MAASTSAISAIAVATLALVGALVLVLIALLAVVLAAGRVLTTSLDALLKDNDLTVLLAVTVVLLVALFTGLAALVVAFATLIVFASSHGVDLYWSTKISFIILSITSQHLISKMSMYHYDTLELIIFLLRCRL